MKAFSRIHAEALFLAKVMIGGNGCHEWTGSLNWQGYGNFRSRFFPEDILAHRVAWAIAAGSPPPKKIGVLHKCDNPKCVRFSHLFLGNQTVNMQDSANKGRHKGMTGKRHPFNRKGFKISREMAEEIRAHEGSQTSIAKKYSIHQSMVSKIKSGRHWSSS